MLGHNLQHILTPEVIAPLLTSSDVVQTLLTYLPPELQTSEELWNVIRSPQLQQAIQTVGYAIETGQLADVIKTLGLDKSKKIKSFVLMYV
jgi:hypothetical protein